jgi:hypothetical protein
MGVSGLSPAGYMPHHDRQFSGARVEGSLGFNDRPRTKRRIPKATTRKPSAGPIQCRTFVIGDIRGSARRLGFPPPPFRGHARRRVARLCRQAAQEKMYAPDDDQETKHDAGPMKDICH